MRNRIIRQKLDDLKQTYVHNSDYPYRTDGEFGCEGFAKRISEIIFGSFPVDKLFTQYNWPDYQFNGVEDRNGWRKYSKGYIANLRLEPGDIILGKPISRGKVYEHAAVIDYISDNTVSVGESVHKDEKSDDFVVKWGNYNTTNDYDTPTKLKSCLVMVYKPPRKKITFETNGGYMEPNVYEYEMFDNIGYLPTPVKQNYTFVGWFPSKDSEREQYSVYNVVEDSQDQTLYARWSDRYYLCRAGRYLTTASPSTGPETGKRIFTRVGDRSVSWCISDGGGVQTIRYSPDVNYSIGMSCDGEPCDESPNNAILRYHTAKEVAGLIKVLYPSDNCYTCRIYHDYLKMYLTGYDNGYVRWERRTKQNEDYQVWTIVEA